MMLLQALTAAAGERAPIGYAKKPIGFLLQVNPRRPAAQLTSLYEQDPAGGGKRPVAPSRWVPNLTRANNPPPLFACDNAAFVLGLPKVAKEPAAQPKEDAAARAKNEAFVELLGEYCAATSDRDADQIIAWYREGKPGLDAAIAALPESLRKRLDVDLIAVAVQRHPPLYAKPEGQAFWESRVMGSQDAATGVCLVCGRTKPLVSTLPQSIAGRLVPATSTANVALLSGNFPAAQRGATGKGLRSAPICAECGLAVVDAFNRLAGSDDHRWGRPDEDRATIWWLRGGDRGDEELTQQLEEPEPQWVQQFLSTLDKPASLTGRDIRADRFYALTFSGNVARLVIRGWIDLPLIEMRANVAAWFRDLAVAYGDQSPYSSLGAVASSLGTMVRRDGGWTAPAPEGAREALLRVAVAGARVPTNYLVTAIARAKAEVTHLTSPDGLTAHTARRRMHTRVGLLKLILNRTHLQEHQLSTELDPERKDKSYLSGRLFAVREALQRRAVRGVTSTITNRYFERAVSNPATTEKTLATLAHQHLAALRRTESGRGAAVSIGRLLTELESTMGDAPSRQTAEQEAAWICGYFQQRQHDFAKATEYRAAKLAGQSQPEHDPNSTADAANPEGTDE